MKNGLEFSHRADPFAARELVDLRCNESRLVGRRFEPCPSRPVAFETWVPGVNQQQGCWGSWRRRRVPKVCCRRFGAAMSIPGSRCPQAPSEISLCQLVELTSCRIAPSCVSVSGEIHQIQASRVTARDAIDIGEPSLAWRGTGPCHALANERVDESRLPDIRASSERDFGKTVAGKIGRGGGAPYEFGFDLQRAGGWDKPGGG